MDRYTIKHNFTIICNQTHSGKALGEEAESDSFNVLIDTLHAIKHTSNRVAFHISFSYIAKVRIPVYYQSCYH